MENKIIIIGAGGHGKVVADAILKQNKYSIAGYADDNIPIGNILNNGYRVICKISEIDKMLTYANYFIVAIGNNNTRSSIYNSLKNKLKPAIIIHPSCILSSNIKLSDGCILLANAVISEDVEIGENCIINSLSLIDHETTINDHVHISQGSIVGSNCKIKSYHTSELGDKIKSYSIL